jgi:hypothetical protein
LNVVRIAFAQMEQVKCWWAEAKPTERFPPIAGQLGKGVFYWLFSTGRMPFILGTVWLALIVLLLVGIWR